MDLFCFATATPPFHRVELSVVPSPTFLQGLVIAMLWGAKDVAHNDIKAANMMVSDEGTLSFIDFSGVTFGEVSST